MAHRRFAEIDPVTNVVTRVIVVESAGLAAELTGTDPAQWVESKQGDPRERPAGIGDRYRPGTREKFERPTDRVATDERIGERP